MQEQQQENLYEKLLKYSFGSDNFDAHEIAELLTFYEAPLSCPKIEEKYKTNILWNIVSSAPDEETAIKLLTIIYKRDEKFIREYEMPVAPLLLYAVEKDKFKLANALIKNFNYDVDTSDRKGFTSLHYIVMGSAIKESRIANGIKFLIEQGADPLKTTNFGQTAFDLAGSALIQEMLLNSPKIADNPDLGEAKKGDLLGVYVYKYNCVNQQFLLAYEFDPLSRTLIALGVHENFYRDLKLNR